MKMLAINPIFFKKRMMEFLFDYLFILTYLVFLFIVSMLIYIIFFNGVPEVSQSLQKFSRSGLYFSPLFCQSPSCLYIWIMQKMGAWGRQKRDLSWSTRKKQFRLA